MRAPEPGPADDHGLQSAIRAAGIGLWELRADGALTWSPILATLAGVAPDASPRTLEQLLTLVHADDRERVRATLAAAFNGGAFDGCDYRLCRPDGELTWLTTTGTLVPALANDGPRLSGIAIDVTRRKHLEARLVRSQRLEAVGLLAAGMAHDFNNQLVAILGYAEFLQRSAHAPDQRRDLDQILEAGRRAATLTAQLLAFTRQEGSDPRVLEVNAVITGMRPMLRRLVGDDLSLETSLASDLPTIRADEGQLQQAIVNLTIEASADCAPGSTIAIASSVLVPGAAGVPEDRTVGIVVSRSAQPGAKTRDGCGSSRVPTHEPGLPLDTARLIAERNGATLVTRDDTGGATYELRFAAARAIAPGPADEPARTPQRGRETILVVDDEPAVRNLLDSVLSRSGYTVLQAGDGPEAQALAAAHPVALLCTDVVMPGGSGIELCRELSAAHPEMRVLYMSGYPERLLADRAALTPANFIRKPFMPADIVRRIRQILDR